MAYKVQFAEPPNTERIPPAHGGQHKIGKIRRAVGDPVAAAKEPLRFEQPPPPVGANFHLPLDVIAPAAAAAAATSKKLVFHCVGDTGGVHGDATQVAVAEAMEAQITEAADDVNKPAFFF